MLFGKKNLHFYFYRKEGAKGANLYVCFPGVLCGNLCALCGKNKEYKNFFDKLLNNNTKFRRRFTI